MKNEFNNLIETEIKNEAKRISDILLKLHKKKVKVNLSYNKLVDEYMDKKFLIFKNDIEIEITKLIPKNLIVSPYKGEIFIEETEYIRLLREEEFNQINKNKHFIENVTNKIINTILNLDSSKEKYDLFEIINNSLNKTQLLILTDNHIKKGLLNNISTELNKKGINIININPLIFK